MKRIALLALAVAGACVFAASASATAPGQISLTPSSFVFAPIPVGQESALLTVTARNIGHAPLQIRGGEPAGDWNSFVFAPGTCTLGEVMNPGDTCTLQFAFEPATAGLHEASFGLLSTAPGPTPAVALSGTGGSGEAVPPQVDHVFVCYSKWEQDGGAVFPAAEAELLVAAGSWLPAALAGNVTGGENVGDYHLACNPPAGITATGSYVGDGGDVSTSDPFGSYAIEG